MPIDVAALTAASGTEPARIVAGLHGASPMLVHQDVAALPPLLPMRYRVVR